MHIFAIYLLLALPWLNPFAPGPSAAAVPLMFSLACGAGLLASVRCFSDRSPASGLVMAIEFGWLTAALLSAVLGLFQYFGSSAFFGPWINHTSVGEAFANLRQRNQFATLTNIGLAVLFWKATKYRIGGAWHGLTAILLAAGNAASGSRTGAAQLVLLVALAYVWDAFSKPEVRKLLLVACFAYGIAAFMLPGLAGLDLKTSGILARLHEGDLVCTSRLTLWSNVLHLIVQRPWLGWGWGELDYAHFVTLYPGPRFCEILDNAHNLPLHLAVELGLPFAVVACFVGALVVVRAKPWKESDPTRQMAWAVLALIMLHSMLEYPLWYGPFQIATGMCIWLLWSTRNRAGGAAAEDGDSRDTHATPPISQPPVSTLPVPRLAVAACSALMLAGVAYASWDYHRISQIYLPPNERSAAYRENTMEKIRDSWLFRNQVLFAELTTTKITPENAAHVNALAQEMLHFSPEARVAEKLIESAVMLGRDDEAVFYLARYRAAFPSEHAAWAKERGLPSSATLQPAD